MNDRTVAYILGLVVVAFCANYAVREFLNSGYYIDKTFSNRLADNRQLPATVEGVCFGGTDILSARVLRETSSSLLLQITYCNEESGDEAVLGISVENGPAARWATTPGGTVAGHGEGLVRLQVSDLPQKVTVSDYTIQMYGNDSGREIIGYPFHYEKAWCTGMKCE